MPKNAAHARCRAQGVDGRRFFDAAPEAEIPWYLRLSTGSDFGHLVIGLGAIDHTFGVGRTLVLKVATTNSSDDDLWLAYGTTSYPTRLNT